MICEPSLGEDHQYKQAFVISSEKGQKVGHRCVKCRHLVVDMIWNDSYEFTIWCLNSSKHERHIWQMYNIDKNEHEAAVCGGKD